MKAWLLVLLTCAAVVGILAARWSQYETLAACGVVFAGCYGLLWRGFDLGRHDRF